MANSSASEHVLTELPLNDLRIDGGTQQRAEINEGVVAEYAEDVDALPPVVVFHDGSAYWLAAGFHRYHAHRKAERETIRCEIRKGTREDGILFACGDNADHGLRRSNADKRKAVLTLLDHPVWGKESARWVARAAAVSNPFVSAIVKERATPDQGVNVNTPTFPGDGEGEDEEAVGPSAVSNGRPTRTRGHKATPRGQIADALGNEVPDALRDVFADQTLPSTLDSLESWASDFHPYAVLQRIKGIARVHPYLRAGDAAKSLEAVERELALLLETLRAGLPDVVCRGCAGAGCKLCRKGGHLPLWRYEELKAEGTF